MALAFRYSISFINQKEPKALDDVVSASVSFAKIKPWLRLQAKHSPSMHESPAKRDSHHRHHQQQHSSHHHTRRKNEKVEKVHAPSAARGHNHSNHKEWMKVPVFVMLPLDTVTMGGTLNKAKAMNASLVALKSAGVEGVMVDAWWGLVEKDGPLNYNWDAYVELVNMVHKHDLKLQVVMSFHQCGGNVGDTCRYIRLYF